MINGEPMNGHPMQYLQCSMRDCDWKTVDRSHLGTVVLVNGKDENGRPNLITMDAVLAMRDELLEHMAETHREDLQMMLAGLDGGRGEPVVVTDVQHVHAGQVRGAEDLVAGTLVPRMRGHFAAAIAKKGLRPLDPWPAVTVLRWCWQQRMPLLEVPVENAPSGMRPAQDGEQPDLYTLELRTLAVTDTRAVTL